MSAEEKTNTVDEYADLSLWSKFKVWMILRLLNGEMCVANARMGVVYMYPTDETKGCLVLNSVLGIMIMEDPDVAMAAMGDDGK